MLDKETKQSNNSDELIDVKSLIVGADGGGFTLDEIMAEYGVPTPKPSEEKQPEESEPEEAPEQIQGGGTEQEEIPEETPEQETDSDLPWPEAPQRPRMTDNVVFFPGTTQEDLQAECEPEEQPEEVQEDREPEELPDNQIPFPEEETPLETLIKDLKGRANDYADRMFVESEQMDEEEIRRLEELIPGTDVEDEVEEKRDVRHVRPPRKQEPPPPDLPPQELARKYGKGLKTMRFRIVMLFLLTVLSMMPLLLPVFDLIWVAPLDDYRVQTLALAVLLGLGMLLSADVLLQTLERMAQMKFGLDTMTLLACLFTLADTIVVAFRQNRGGHLPLCCVNMVALLLLSHGDYHKRCALRLNCRTAAASAEPYVVTMDRGLWNGKDTYTKWSGVPNGFGSQVQMDDGAQRIYKKVVPVLMADCVLFSLLASVGVGKVGNLLWALSCTFTAGCALGGSLTFGRPFHKITRRLNQSGAALGGWSGISQVGKGDRVLITDWDLFPPGYVALNGIKVFGDHSMERVVAYTATLLRDSGSGLEKLFHDLLRSQGGIFRHAEQLACYDGGGLSALIRGDQVLVGSAAFMNLMEVELPQGLNVKNAVFCAIEGELAGIFALNYSLPDVVFPSLVSLFGEKVSPVLATRDFNVIPAMLQQRFKLAADRMDFPPVQRRCELSDPNQDHSEIITAVLCREGLGPFAEAVVGARRLRRATRVGAVLACFGSALGIVLTAYLVSMSAFSNLSCLNVLIYLFMWLAPVWFLTDWAPRY